MIGWRIARPEEIARMWPAARTSHVAATLSELEDFYARGPWRVRVSDAGDAMVLARWRSHLDLLAIRGLWVADHRVGALVLEARAVARAQGFTRVLTPLLACALHRPYEQAGMSLSEPIVALQGLPGRVAMRSARGSGASLRRARRDDLERVEEIDRACFDDFWRYGRFELEAALTDERVMVAEDEGLVLGYASATIRNGTCTLARLAVAPEARRGGIGRALVTDTAAWASMNAAAVLSLCTQETNAASRALYASCGMFEVDERYGILGIDS